MSLPTAAPAMPALFVSHGAPTFALESDSSAAQALRTWGQALPQRPRAVLVLSAHWMAAQPDVMAAPQPATWHDFGGFDRALYRLQYPAPGAPAMAAQVQALLQAAGWASALDGERPRDHGAWVPLLHLLPQADVPVLQLALPARADAAQVYALGQALAPLRTQGVLLLGSGAMTHNLGDFGLHHPGQGPVPYVQAFSDWVHARLLAGERDALLDYRRQAPHAQRAHPTQEHFLPLFFALGAAQWGQPGSTCRVEYLLREIHHRLIAMDAISVQ